MNTRRLLTLAALLAGAALLRPGDAGGEPWRATVTVTEPALAAMQGFAAFDLPLAPVSAAANLRLVDETGEAVPVRVNELPALGVARVTFALGAGTVYRVGPAGEAADTAASPRGEFPEPGDLLLEDYPVPGVRTSGSWQWQEQPRLSGRFSHHGHRPGAFYHAAYLPRPRPLDGDRRPLVQYLYIDADDPPREIMVAVTAARGGRRGQQTFFAWGEGDLFQWPDMEKRPQGPLPETGRWIRLELPLADLPDRADRLTGLGFYYHGGRVFWGRTSLGEVPARAAVTRWEIPGRPVSPFFTVEQRGPFADAGGTFSLLLLDGSAAAGAHSFEWEVGRQRASGERAALAVPAGGRVRVRLAARGEGTGEAAVLEREVPLAGGEPGQLDLALAVRPYQNLLAVGEEVTLTFRATNLTPEPLPVTIAFGDEERSLELLPGDGNSRYEHFVRFAPPAAGVSRQSVRLAVGGRRVREKTFLFSGLPWFDGRVQGPYFKDEDGAHLVGVLPGFRLAGPGEAGLPAENAVLLLLGDYPPGLPAALERRLAAAGRRVRLRAFSFPEQGEGLPMLERFLALDDDDFPAAGADLALVFPCLADMRAGAPAPYWRRAFEAALWTLARRGIPVMLATPFPVPPEPAFFEPWRRIIAEIAAAHEVPLVDLYALYQAGDDWPSLFRAAPGVYRELPGREGLAPLVEYLGGRLAPAGP